MSRVELVDDFLTSMEEVCSSFCNYILKEAESEIRDYLRDVYGLGVYAGFTVQKAEVGRSALEVYVEVRTRDSLFDNLVYSYSIPYAYLSSKNPKKFIKSQVANIKKQRENKLKEERRATIERLRFEKRQIDAELKKLISRGEK